MMWGAPWALLGLIAVVGPLVVHWLARQQSTRLRFPTLTFLTPTPPVSVRRHRIQDWPLLLIRMAMVALAAVALAQPVWLQSARPEATPSRAIVLDTSQSLQRMVAGAGGGPDAGPVERVAAEAALETAQTLVSESAPRSRMVETPDVPSGVIRAAAWLARQPAPRELVVVSDFQEGALAAPDLEAVPFGVGVRLVPIAVDGPVPLPSADPVQLLVSVAPDAAHLATATEDAARQWLSAPPAPAGLAQTASEAGATVRVVFAGAPDEASLRAAAVAIDSPPLFDRLSRIAADVRALGLDMSGTEWQAVDGTLTAFSTAPPGSTDAAALVAAILRSGVTPLSLAERNPAVVDARVWSQWQRPTTGEATPPVSEGDGRPVGRWLWLLVLGLMVVETWRRRSLPAVTSRPQRTGA